MRHWFTPLRVGGGIVAVLLLTLLILYRIPSGDYLLLPDVAHPVSPLVHVQGAHPAKGGELFFVDVREQRASELESLFPWLHPHGTLLPAEAIVPPGSNGAAVRRAELQQMSISQRVAAAVALRRLGYHVVVRENGVIVSVIELGTHAAGKLQPQDVIIAVDGVPTATIAQLHARLSRVSPGDVVDLRIRRGPKVLTVPVKTVDDGGRALVGFEPAQSVRIKLPLRVSIDAGGIGGPSAGLAFALEVMEQLGRDVVHGHRVAATGEIGLNGEVTAIGGVEQKTYGVRAAHADVFLVPAGSNAKTARKYAGPLRIIPVHSLSQALHALATLPRGG